MRRASGDAGTDAVPRVSVIVPTFDRADLVGHTLESIAEQSYGDWECIVVDDGSTDDTPAVVQRFVAADPRFRYLRRSRSSASAARNHGLQHARGEFAAFLDSDDLYLPDKLQWQVAALSADPSLLLVYGDAFHFRSLDPREGYVYLERVAEKPTGDAFEGLLTCSAIYAPLVRTEVLREIGGFDETLPSAEDWDMWLEVARRGPILYRPMLSLLYRLHQGGKSTNILRNYRCARRVADKHLVRVLGPRQRTVSEAVRSNFRDIYTGPLLRQAASLNEDGRWEEAREVWMAVALLNPVSLLTPRVFANAAWAALPTDRAPFWRSPPPGD